MRRARPLQHGAAGPAVEVRRWPRPGCSWSCGRTSAGVACATGARGRASARQLAAARARGDGAHGLGEQGEREIRPLPPQNAGCGCVRGAAGAGARSDLAISNCARPDHEQDAGGAEICCRPDRRPGMTQDLAGAAPARGRSPAVDRVGSEDHVLHPRALCRRSASHACGQRRRVVRRAESRRARCARGRRALVVCARSPRVGGQNLFPPNRFPLSRLLRRRARCGRRVAQTGALWGE